MTATPHSGLCHSVRILENPRFQPAAVSEASPFGAADSRAALTRVSTWPDYAPTPLHSLPAAAARARVADLYCKDEGARLGLQSFKALGAVYAAVRVVTSLLEERSGEAVKDEDLLRGRHAERLGDVVLACATDGNHGFSVAYAARRMGCAARIYIPRGVSRAREKALRAEGAEVVRIDGIYEEAVAAASTAAEKEPATMIVSDYATDSYRDIPVFCMIGYSIMTLEMAAQLGDSAPTHVFLPAGCGGLAAAMIASMSRAWPERPPRFVVVEPTTAACVFASAQAGKSVQIGGDLDTIMGGLSCAAVSSVAWPTLDAGASAFMTMDDTASAAAMREFAAPREGDPRIVAGETGAAGLGAFLAVQDDTRSRELLAIDRSSRILVINCESAADRALYEEIVGAAP